MTEDTDLPTHFIVHERPKRTIDLKALQQENQKASQRRLILNFYEEADRPVPNHDPRQKLREYRSMVPAMGIK